MIARPEETKKAGKRFAKEYKEAQRRKVGADDRADDRGPEAAQVSRARTTSTISSTGRNVSPAVARCGPAHHALVVDHEDRAAVEADRSEDAVVTTDRLLDVGEQGEGEAAVLRRDASWSSTDCGLMAST